MDLNISFASDYEVIAHNTAAKQLLQTISFDLGTKKRQESQSSSTNEFARRPISLAVTPDSRLFVFHFNSRESTLLYSSSIPENPDSLCSISIPDNPDSLCSISIPDNPDSLCSISIPDNPDYCVPFQFQIIQSLCVPFQFQTIHTLVFRFNSRQCRLFVFHFNSRESRISHKELRNRFHSLSTILSRHHQRNQEQMSESCSARHQKFETFTSVVQVELNELNLSESIRRQQNTCVRQLKFRPVDRFRLLEKRESNPWWRTQGFRQSPSLSEHRAHLYA